MYAYAPRRGFHISKREAVVIGAAKETVVKRYGEGFSIDVFAGYCRRSSGEIHRIWDDRRQKLESAAGHEAARYLLNGVQRIVLRTEKSPAQTAPMVVILPKFGKSSGEDEERVFTGEEAQGRVDLVQQAEEKMLRQVQGEIDSFALLAGSARAIRAVEQLLASY